MARRVRRVKRTKRVSRLKTAKEVAAKDGVAGAADGGPDPIDADGPDGGGSFKGGTHKQRRSRARRKGGPGSVDGDADPLGHDGEVDDSGAETALGVRRKGGNDGFDGGHQEKGREAYEAYLKGQVAEDAQRFEQLREQGAHDVFDPEAPPGDVERKGQMQAAAHMIRLYDHWTLQGVDRAGAIEKAASWLGAFTRTDNVRKVLAELESKPIRDVYPLEVLLELLESAPDKLPGVKEGSLLGEAPALREDRVYAGHPVQLPVPPNVRLKAFALLGGHRPGYEFFPSQTKDDQYTLLVDTPGTWSFALLGVRTQPLGKMTKELPGGIVEKLSVHVKEMGRKEAPAGA